MYKKIIILAGVLGLFANAYAKENITNTNTVKRQALLKTTAANCLPATAAIDIDINNVRARLMTGGDQWWNIGTQVAAYEIPKGSGKSSQFAASCWIGGFDANGQLKVAAQTYRQDGNDYWPGALDNSGAITADQCAAWDRFWKIDRTLVNDFISDYNAGRDITGSKYDVINQWPAVGNSSSAGVTMYAGNTYAPFVDLNNDGMYEPASGEYPSFGSNNAQGDQYIWWVFNDAGNAKQQSQTAAMGIEVQTSAFAYSATNFLNNSTFVNYRVINRGHLTIDSTYIAVWDDCDLGYAFDDFIGCDTARGLGIQYNGRSVDGEGEVNSYGSDVPQVGIDFFQGPKRHITTKAGKDSIQQLGMTNFTYYNNTFDAIGNPSNGIEIYYYMTGSTRFGVKFSDDFKGAGVPSHGYGSGPATHYVFFGDPGDQNQWSECACTNVPNDRRFITSSGPFVLEPGAINDITFGCIWAPGVGGCPKTNFKTITSIDDQAQALFDNGFKTLKGPDAPKLTIRELDKKLILYIENPYGSNNYKEQYGSIDPNNLDSAALYNEASAKAKAIKNADSLYKFEGYRIFQLANSNLSSSDIFDANGQVIAANAKEIRTIDIRDGVTNIINNTKNSATGDAFVPYSMVVGSDSGIVHTLEVTTDAFATQVDQSLTNYKSYYFVAVAYAYNDFNRGTSRGAGFNPAHADSTQDMAYLGTQTNVSVATGIPNPANGNMGTVLGSDYGEGVIIHRIEGTGNGGSFLELNDSSENEALQNKIAKVATYVSGQAPVTVKVVDPVSVVAANWELYITGNEYAPNSVQDSDASARRGIMAGTGAWHLRATMADGTSDDLYSERDLTVLNEQILDKYGLSVSLKQVARPGDDQQNNRNGFITSNISYQDSTIQWLTGVPDASDSSFLNWQRSGNNKTAPTIPCYYRDNVYDTALGYTGTGATTGWSPYSLTAYAYGTSAFTTSGVNAVLNKCPFTVAYSGTSQSPLYALPSVDIVFDSDRSHWTRCLVLEEEEDPALAEGGVKKFQVRSHRSWNGDVDDNGRAKYATDKTDTGMSWFPGYAINQETGERLNIIFGEDSYLGADNGKDMLWNPTANLTSFYDQSVLFGGKHYIYVLGTRYDSDNAFNQAIHTTFRPNTSVPAAFNQIQWVGLPLLSGIAPLRSIANGLIPTKTRLRFRVNRPFASYTADSSATTIAKDNNSSQPYYTFTTNGLQATPVSDNTDKNALLNRINVVPNPYTAYSGYETNRYDTRVRIINLPARATVYIYALDGSLIRTLTKSDGGSSYLDWDIRNSAGLPIASGMYMMDVKAEGIGETVLRWFGAMRPIDITTY